MTRLRVGVVAGLLSSAGILSSAGCGARTGVAPIAASLDGGVSDGEVVDGGRTRPDGRIVDPDGGPPPCVPASPPIETCNGRDDDCDGAIDEDLGFDLVSGPHEVTTSIAFIPALTGTDDGLLAAWRTGFNGSSPVPNSFARPLDRDGRPTGPAVQLLEAPVILGPGLTRAPGRDRYYAPLCRRFGGNDLPSWLRLDGSGRPVGEEHVVERVGESCVTYDTTPQMLFTGRRTLFAWIGARSFVPAFLERSDDGRDPEVVEVVPNGDLSAPPRLVRVGDRVAFIVGVDHPETRASTVTVTWLDLDGEIIGATAELPDPGGSGYLQPRGAPDGDGNLLVVASHRFDEGWIRARVGRGGGVIEDPILLPEDLEIRGLAPRPGGGFWMSASDNGAGVAVLQQLSAAGDIVEEWPVPEPSWQPELVVHGGRVTLLYGSPTGGETALHSVTYGCVPAVRD